MGQIYNKTYIRSNRVKLLFSKSAIFTGLALIAYTYYLTYLTPFWNFNLLLYMFITGCTLVLLGFSGKAYRRWTSRHEKIHYVRTGDCVNCGTCCRVPVRCIFLKDNKCSIHHNRPVQCRTYPTKPQELISPKCGYNFVKK